MKRIIIWVLLLCLLVLVIVGASVLYKRLSDKLYGGGLVDLEQENETDEIKNTAPDFKVLTSDGEEVNLSDYFGQPIVINFWATWCVYCKEEMPDFDRARRENPDVLFMMVNAGESISTGMAYINGKGYELEIFFDMSGEACEAYDVTGYPTTYFIDKNGNTVKKKIGKISYEALTEGVEAIK